MLLLFPNTQRQGVLMTPDGPCVGPQTAHSSTSGDFLTIVTPTAITGVWPDYGGGGRWMRLVWVFWKDVWNRSMGIKGLGSVGGLLCWRLSPLLASMISSIDTEAVLRSLCVFVNLFLTLPSPSLTLSHPVSAHLPPPVLLSLRSPVGVHWIHTNSCEWRQVIFAVFHIRVWRHVI